MRGLILAAACLGLAACEGFGLGGSKTAEVAEPTDPSLYRADCYTVVLFDKHVVQEPDKDLPAEHAAYLGRWTNGAWNGEWCHDLLVTEVRTDGTVSVVEMHAPYEPWNQPATAFKRTGRISENGELRFAYGIEQVSYRLSSDGRLMAKRSGTLGELEAELRKEGWVQIPVPRPATLASSG